MTATELFLSRYSNHVLARIRFLPTEANNAPLLGSEAEYTDFQVNVKENMKEDRSYRFSFASAICVFVRLEYAVARKAAIFPEL